MIQNKIAILSGSLCLILLSGPLQADEASDTRAFMLAASCFGCHGTDGQSPGSIPTLYGKSKNFVVTALQEYKTDASQGTVMNRLAKGYSDEEIELIGEWFAAMSQEG
jgi:cytochrome subunit of sulfide dehydrogenase